MVKRTPYVPRRITCDIQVERDGTVAIRWDGGASKDDALRTIQTYMNIALRFANDLGGCDNAYQAMCAIIRETREMQSKAGPPKSDTIKIADI